MDPQLKIQSLDRFSLAVTLALITCLGQPVSAQMTTQALIGNAVEKPGPEYKDVDDAILLFRRGNPDGAVKLLQSAKSKRPELPPAEVMLAHLCFAYNQAAQGHTILELAALKAPADPEPYVMLADVAMRQRQFVESDLLFERGLELANQFKGNDKRKRYLQINAHAGLAMVDESRGLWKEAELHLRSWIELDEKNAGAWKRLAKTMFQQQQFENARTTLERLKTFDKSQPEPEISMGLLFEQAGQREEARQAMDAALKKSGKDKRTRLAVASWALYAGEIDLAETNAKEVLKMDVASIRAKMILGMIARFRNDAVGAEQTFRVIHEETPANFDATNNLALSLLAQDDQAKHRQALEFATVNVRTNPDLRRRAGREAAATLAWALYKVGQDAAAEQTIQKILKAGEVSPDTAYYAAKIFHRRGHAEAAARLLRGALKSTRAFPDRDDAEKLLASLDGPSNDEEGEKVSQN